MSESDSTRPIQCRGVRGATTVETNTPAEILKETRVMLALIIRLNQIDPNDVAGAFFSTTPDINAEFPALAARQLGWMNVSLMCGHEMTVPGALAKCVRVMILWNTRKSADEIQHVYIKGAKTLRPDKADLPEVDWDELQRWIDSEIDPEIQSKR